MEKKIGFIGCGKMAQAMIEGMLGTGTASRGQIMVSASSEQTLEFAREKYGVLTSRNNKEVASHADFLILAVKPDLHRAILSEIRTSMEAGTVIITIAAGVSLHFIEKELGGSAKVVRTMPNTPSLIGEGLSAVCRNQQVTDEELSQVLALYNSFGKTEVLKEELMDAVPAISGSSPAYVYMFIEALADGGVRDGIPRAQAYTMAAQAVLGAAKMVLETGMHPGALKDNVCTPGGATIQAVAALEQHNFRAAILSAMESCTQKSKDLQRGNQ
ncbi:pyrroline-5-carboxylate reductase [Peribacillus deserti]|uniref:Pyrroline-5-carboxylate reductase n=1 Tax=Peribacillus deserti TaxID=673318 RepID=A0ABS2QD62_9BACI|nr:pyrroline-5-carboxylate reductase [Peribacillus deserti]MBM7691032.1 pyrroline-5-carboxylate reductase [Peribacillus deserti]